LPIIVGLEGVDLPTKQERKRYDFAACELSKNPAYQMADISGGVVLAQSPYGGPVFIRAEM